MEPNASQPKTRLDVAMADKGLVRSRSAAQDLIKRGKVSVNGKPATKPSTEIGADDRISLADGPRFVSRAGEKLEAALEHWKIDASGAVAVDVGSSTGGFTECLLKRGASRVVAIEIGTDQMDGELRLDPRVELHEETDVRKFSLPSPADLVVADVSFISLTHILPKAFELLRPGGQAVLLVKPQFEVGREIAQKRKGVITDESERRAALEGVATKAKEVGFKVVGHIDSPIEGEGGNREYLLQLKR